MANNAAKAKAAKKAAGPLTQAQVVSTLAEKSGLTKKQVKGLLEELSALAVAQTKKHGKFVVPGLGRLVRTDRKARWGRNPATGEKIRIAAKKVVKFRLAKATADQIVPPKKK